MSLFDEAIAKVNFDVTPQGGSHLGGIPPEEKLTPVRTVHRGHAPSMLFQGVNANGPKAVQHARRTSFNVSGATYPWQVYAKKFAGATSWVVGVNGESNVVDGIGGSGKTVEGLLTNPLDVGDGGWMTPIQGYLYIEGTIVDGAVDGNIMVQIGADLPDAVSSSAGKQTKFTKVLGYIWPMTVGTLTIWQVRQMAYRDVTLLYVTVNGVLCKVPFEM